MSFTKKILNVELGSASYQSSGSFRRTQSMKSPCRPDISGEGEPILRMPMTLPLFCLFMLRLRAGMMPVLAENWPRVQSGSKRLDSYVGPIEPRFKNRAVFVGAIVMGDQALLGVVACSPPEQLAVQSFVHRAILGQAFDRLANCRRRRFVRFLNSPSRAILRRFPLSRLFDELRYRHATTLGCGPDFPGSQLRSIEGQSRHGHQVSPDSIGHQAGQFILRQLG
jgi:hypothetical protein